MAALGAATLTVALTTLAPSVSAAAHAGAIQFAPCPRVAKAEGEETKTDRNPRAAEATVPMTPSALQLCRYYGLGYHQTPKTRGRIGKLRSERVLRKATAVRSIASEFDALTEFPEGATSCPSDEGARLYAIFAYANDEPVVPVEVKLSGCPFASNGRTQAAYWAKPQLIRRLKALTSGKSYVRAQ